MHETRIVTIVMVIAVMAVAVTAMELAILSQLQQDADAQGCQNSPAASLAINASKGRCIRSGG